MPRPEPKETRGQLRAWLKTAVQTTLLDRVPPDYEPEGPGSGGPARDYARGLLARLQAIDPATTPPDDLLAEIRAFRSWVEGRLQASRRIILGGGSAEEPPIHRLDRPRAPSPRDRPQPPRPEPPARPELDPMWDRWVDG